ncbi:MAG: hypothetical protein ACOYXT_04140 [Bacteroidota bacterium]
MKDVRKNKDDDSNEVFVLRPYTHKELAQLYNVSWLTFQRWIKDKEQEIGKKQGHFYHIHQVLKIFKIFGIPKRFKITMQEVEEMFKNA